MVKMASKRLTQKNWIKACCIHQKDNDKIIMQQQQALTYIALFSSTFREFFGNKGHSIIDRGMWQKEFFNIILRNSHGTFAGFTQVIRCTFAVLLKTSPHITGK